jgi:hypothetical protein
MTSLMVRIMRSTLPFCGEVYEYDIRSWTPWERKKVRAELLISSIIALDTVVGATKLRGNVGEEVRGWGKSQI